MDGGASSSKKKSVGIKNINGQPGTLLRKGKLGIHPRREKTNINRSEKRNQEQTAKKKAKKKLATKKEEEKKEKKEKRQNERSLLEKGLIQPGTNPQNGHR